MDDPLPSDLEALASTERELFSLYARYPEINFESDSTEKLPEYVEQFSSPASNAEDPDEIDSFQASSSTRHTTPLKHDLFSVSDDEYTAFCKQLRNCDLPSATVQYLNTLSSQILQMSRNLDRVLADAGILGFVTQVCDGLVDQFKDSANNINEQLQSIAFLTELVPFNIIPTDVSLWSNYKQRASLVSKHLLCPSQTELKLLTSLLCIFDAYVYNPYLHRRTLSYQQAATDNELSRVTTQPTSILLDDHINSLYSALLTLLAQYQRWIRTLTNFRQGYMTPIMRRIQDSPWIQREIEQNEATLEAAKAAVSTSASSSSASASVNAASIGQIVDGQAAAAPPGLLMTTEQVHSVVKWAEKRRALQKGHGNTKSEGNGKERRVRGRYKREYTI